MHAPLVKTCTMPALTVQSIEEPGGTYRASWQTWRVPARAPGTQPCSQPCRTAAAQTMGTRSGRGASGQPHSGAPEPASTAGLHTSCASQGRPWCSIAWQGFAPAHTKTQGSDVALAFHKSGHLHHVGNIALPSTGCTTRASCRTSGTCSPPNSKQRAARCARRGSLRSTDARASSQCSAVPRALAPSSTPAPRRSRGKFLKLMSSFCRLVHCHCTPLAAALPQRRELALCCARNCV